MVRSENEMANLSSRVHVRVRDEVARLASETKRTPSQVLSIILEDLLQRGEMPVILARYTPVTEREKEIS